MEIHELKQNDISSLANLQPTGWLDIKPLFDIYLKSNFCYPIKIIISNKIVGIGTTVIHNDVAWLAHIIVHSKNRNKGIGNLITNELIKISKEKNCSTIYLIATDMGAPVYEKIGFETETEYLFFKNVNYKKKDTTYENIIPFTNNLKDQIANLDKRVSGENRSFHLEQHLQNAYVFKNNNIVEGFYLPSFGEGLIIADTSYAGVELMKLRLELKRDAIFPSSNLKAKEFMSSYNYNANSKAKRMRLGVKREVLFQNIYNRIGGNIG